MRLSSLCTLLLTLCFLQAHIPAYAGKNGSSTGSRLSLESEKAHAAPTAPAPSRPISFLQEKGDVSEFTFYLGSKKYRVKKDVFAQGSFGYLSEVAEVHAGGGSSEWNLALKQLKPELVEVESVVADFEREAEILEDFQGDPHFVQVYARGKRTNSRGGLTPFILMEKMEGEPLSHFIHRRCAGAGRGISQEETDLIMKELLEGVMIMHQKGVIHRDLKPENIHVLFYRDEGTGQHRAQVKIFDLGLGRMRKFVGAADESRGPEAGKLARRSLMEAVVRTLGGDELTIWGESRADFCGTPHYLDSYSGHAYPNTKEGSFLHPLSDVRAVGGVFSALHCDHARKIETAESSQIQRDIEDLERLGPLSAKTVREKKQEHHKALVRGVIEAAARGESLHRWTHEGRWRSWPAHHQALMELIMNQPVPKWTAEKTHWEVGEDQRTYQWREGARQYQAALQGMQEFVEKVETGDVPPVAAAAGSLEASPREGRAAGAGLWDGVKRVAVGLKRVIDGTNGLSGADEF